MTQVIELLEEAFEKLIKIGDRESLSKAIDEIDHLNRLKIMKSNAFEDLFIKSNQNIFDNLRNKVARANVPGNFKIIRLGVNEANKRIKVYDYNKALEVLNSQKYEIDFNNGNIKKAILSGERIAFIVPESTENGFIKGISQMALIKQENEDLINSSASFFNIRSTIENTIGSNETVKIPINTSSTATNNTNPTNKTASWSKKDLLTAIGIGSQSAIGLSGLGLAGVVTAERVLRGGNGGKGHIFITQNVGNVNTERKNMLSSDTQIKGRVKGRVIPEKVAKSTKSMITGAIVKESKEAAQFIASEVKKNIKARTAVEIERAIRRKDSSVKIGLAQIAKLTRLERNRKAKERRDLKKSLEQSLLNSKHN